MEKSNQLIQILDARPGSLKLKLNSAAQLDLSVFSKMERDALSAGCLLADAKEGILLYQLKNRITLKEFFSRMVFEKEDGYAFLKLLLENMISCARNKGLLYDPDYIFVSDYGDSFEFIVLPICTEAWMDSRSRQRELALWIADEMKTTTAYELKGFIAAAVRQEDFSLAMLAQSLCGIRQLYYPRKWYRKKSRSFRLKEKMEVYQPDSVLSDLQWQQISSIQTSERQQAKREEKIEAMEEREEKTQLIGECSQENAWLEKDGQRYDLLFETMTAGRSMQCDIRLPSAKISLQHARLTENQGRWYIQDLHSSNGTFLNDKQVQRKMRLKEGMILRLADEELIFHEACLH